MFWRKFVFCLGLFFLMAYSVRADVCLYSPVNMAKKASLIINKLSPEQEIVSYCSICENDDEPIKMSFAKADVQAMSEGEMMVTLDGEAIDLAYLYLREGEVYYNLGAKVGCVLPKGVLREISYAEMWGRGRVARGFDEIEKCENLVEYQRVLAVEWDKKEASFVRNKFADEQRACLESVFEHFAGEMLAQNQTEAMEIWQGFAKQYERYYEFLDEVRHDGNTGRLGCFFRKMKVNASLAEFLREIMLEDLRVKDVAE